MKYIGGCLCGQLRYQSSVGPNDTGYCHCRLCQRSTGAPVLAWASFPVDGFEYSKGSPAIYQSSEHGHREFYSNCGTQIAFRESNHATTVDVNTGSLDDPSTTPPQIHIWCQSQIEWFDTRDELPRYKMGEENGGDS
jgi:hypothetical protein